MTETMKSQLRTAIDRGHRAKELAVSLATEEGRSPFAERMRELREQAGLTQGEVGRWLGIKQSAYADWEAGSTGFRRMHLVALAALYRMPLTRAFPGAI